MKKIALAGNPNCGKTTLFNRLTGQQAHVGNWPGVTVDCKQACLRGQTDLLIDLPGLYSLSAFSPEEAITRDLLVNHEGPVWNLIRPDSMERGLYLTLQLRELGCDTLLVLAEEVPTLDTEALSRGLGIPVTVANALPVCPKRGVSGAPPRYGRALEGAIAQAAGVLSHASLKSGSLRFWAISALEGSPPLCTKEQQRRLEAIRAELEQKSGQESDTLIASERYRFIDELLCAVGKKPTRHKKAKPDRVLLHPFWALPLFGVLMALLFWVCFGLPGQLLQNAMSSFVAALSGKTTTLLEVLGASPAIRGLVCDGVFGGLGTVLCFLPQLALLFAGMALLEESGYLARAAFLTDRILMKRVGVSGKAFVPLLMGFGCTTSAVLAARTLRTPERERVITLLPFCSCGAKLPVYALLAEIFFPGHAGLVVAACYLFSFGVGLVFVLIAGRKQGKAPFLLEMPAYRVPSLRALLRGTWERCAEFLRKAGTVIFAVGLWIWLMGHIQLTPFPMLVSPEQSVLMGFACKIAPLLAPLGFAAPEAAVALLAGIAGKEAIVSTFGVLCGTGGSAVLMADAIRGLFTPLSAVSFLVFCSLYSPCMSTLAVIGKELSYRKAIFAAVWHTALAYGFAALVYQVGCLLMTSGVF